MPRTPQEQLVHFLVHVVCLGKLRMRSKLSPLILSAFVSGKYHFPASAAAHVVCGLPVCEWRWVDIV